MVRAETGQLLFSSGVTCYDAAAATLEALLWRHLPVSLIEAVIQAATHK